MNPPSRAMSDQQRCTRFSQFLLYGTGFYALLDTDPRALVVLLVGAACFSFYALLLGGSDVEEEGSSSPTGTVILTETPPPPIEVRGEKPRPR